MEATRPLMRMGVADLESLFKEQSQNALALAELDAELAQRRGTRALVLRERVQRTLKRLEAERASLRPAPSNLMSAPPVQVNKPGRSALPEGPLSAKKEDAFSGLELQQPVVQQDLLTGLQSLEKPSSTKASGAAASVALANKSTTPVEPEALPQLSIEDACRILKVASGNVWEKVEAARRKIVSKTSPLATKGMPAAQVQTLLSEAQMANDAAIVIAARRSGRR